MPLSYAMMQSRIHGAWPGEIGRLGKLPRSWNMTGRGLNAAVVRIGTVGPADTFDLRLYGAARSAGTVILYMGQLVVIPGGAQTIATTLGLAIIAGSKVNINKAMIGIETRDAGNTVLASPSNDVAEWPMLGVDARIVRNTVAIAGSFTTVAYWFGLDVVVGQPIDITIRFGWSGAETAAGIPVRATAPAALNLT